MEGVGGRKFFACEPFAEPRRLAAGRSGFLSSEISHKIGSSEVIKILVENKTPPPMTGIFYFRQAGKGNRTPGASLENWGITTIRYPRFLFILKHFQF